MDEQVETPVEETIEAVVEPTVETPVVDSCSACQGTGLKDQFTVCPVCNGDGKARNEALDYEEGTMIIKKGVGTFLVKNGKMVQV